MADGSVTINTQLDNSGFKSGLSKLGSVASSALKGVTVVAGATTAAVTGIGIAAISSYAELEQNIGGIETLFGNSAEKVIKNAEKAYKTAGMSANDYMSTVTSFSASLLQSVGGDTEKAAKSADMAITDMSDNANKMGTSIEMIQNAYQGFAKQNYTMLDNLKLGYGGTRTEMERLLKDAQKLSGQKYDISNLNDVYEAIHIVQKEMGITGTTAKEASETIAGSTASMKSAWKNLLTGIADDNADFGKLISNFIDSVITVADNLLPRIEIAIDGVIELGVQLVQQFLKQLPNIMNAGSDIIFRLIDGMTTMIPEISYTAFYIVQEFLSSIISMLPIILQIGIDLLLELINGITQTLPELIPTAIDAVILMVETLIDNIDMIIDAGIELILALAEGLIEALPRLIEKIPVIIEKLINAIVNNLPKIIQMGVTLIIKLASGLVQAIPQLVAKIPQIISALVSGLANAGGQLVNAGANLIKGIWQGMSNTMSWIWGKISGFCNTIVSKIKSFFGIHSPSKLFNQEIGQNLGLGLGEGFEDSLSGVYKDMQRAVDYENAKLTSNLTNSHQISLMNEDNTQSRLASIDNNKEIQVNSTLEVDGNKMASVVNRVNARQKLQYGMA